MQGRGEPVTIEERNLATDSFRREAVLSAYREFEVTEIDTSNLSPDEVLAIAIERIDNHAIAREFTNECNEEVIK